MTTTPSSTLTTIQIRRGANTALSISYDYTALESSTLPFQRQLQSQIDQAIRQWWDSLTNFQKSGPLGLGLSLKISASFLRPSQE